MIIHLIRRSGFVLVAMLVAAGLAVAAKPHQKIADDGPPVDLEALIPKQIGAWKVDERVRPVIPDPSTQSMLNKIYNQTLARTYIDGEGHSIMLSVAYGGDQSDNMQVHRPEICYAAQGFQILSEAKGLLTTAFGTLPVKRVVAQQGPRVEPITYWVTVGNEATAVGLRQKLAQLSYGLTGKVPDGMLVRVSSIDRNELAAYTQQESFIRELLAATSTQARQRLGVAGPL